MQHIELAWTSKDGLQLYAQEWRPDHPPKAVVCLEHGIGEHSGRYGHVAQALADAGYALLAYDLRGSGKSQGVRGHAPSFDALMDDIALLLDQAAQRFPELPRFLYGHSLGAHLVLNYVLRRKPQLAGVVVTGPALRPGFEPPAWKVSLGRVLYKLVPALTMNNELDVDKISRDPAVVSKYKADPLVHERISARLGIDVLDNGLWALDHAAEFPLPLLIMHGEADGITSFPASREFAGKVPGDVTFKSWPGLYHELHNEPEQGEVLAVIVDWLDRHVVRKI